MSATPIMPFGPHKGLPLDQVPTSYLVGLVRYRTTGAGFRYAIRQELLTRSDCPRDLRPTFLPKRITCYGDPDENDA